MNAFADAGFVASPFADGLETAEFGMGLRAGGAGIVVTFNFPLGPGGVGGATGAGGCCGSAAPFDVMGEVAAAVNDSMPLGQGVKAAPPAFAGRGTFHTCDPFGGTARRVVGDEGGGGGGGGGATGGTEGGDAADTGGTGMPVGIPAVAVGLDIAG